MQKRSGVLPTLGTGSTATFFEVLGRFHRFHPGLNGHPMSVSLPDISRTANLTSSRGMYLNGSCDAGFSEARKKRQERKRGRAGVREQEGPVSVNTPAPRDQPKGKQEASRGTISTWKYFRKTVEIATQAGNTAVKMGMLQEGAELLSCNNRAHEEGEGTDSNSQRADPNVSPL